MARFRRGKRRSGFSSPGPKKTPAVSVERVDAQRGGGYSYGLLGFLLGVEALGGFWGVVLGFRWGLGLSCWGLDGF